MLTVRNLFFLAFFLIAAGVFFSCSHDKQIERFDMIHKPVLPFNQTDLMPYMSEETVDYHYGKHHIGYYNKLMNQLKDQPELSDKNLLELIRYTAGQDDMKPIFNNAAQIYNHYLFWQSVSVKPTKPCPQGQKLIEQNFGSIDQFKMEFSAAANGLFGSGWVWLIQNKNGRLEIVQTGNAETPVVDPEVTPLLVLDVWEHAYYIDHRNNRAKFVDDYLTHLINWDHVCKILKHHQ